MIESYPSNIPSGVTIVPTVSGASHLGTSDLPFGNITASNVESPNIAAISGMSSVGQINLSVDGAGSAISTGEKSWVRIPHNCTLTGWDMTADQSTTTVVDVWVDTYGNFPPTDADSITNGNEPTITADTKAQDTDISDWSDVTMTAGNYMLFNVDSTDNAQKLNLTIYLTKD